MRKITKFNGTITEAWPIITSIVDNYVLYTIAKKLVSSLEKWPAYKVGLIDKRGNILVPKNKRTKEQRNSLTNLDIFVLNIKRIFIKATGRDLGGLATLAAGFLLREQENFDFEKLNLEDTEFINKITPNKFLMEEAEFIANTSSDNITGSSEEAAKAFNKPKKFKRRRLVSRFDRQSDDE